MSQLPTSWRTVLIYSGLTLPFVVMLALGWSTLLAVETDAVIVVGLLPSLVAWLAIQVMLQRLLEPVDRWEHAEQVRDEQLLAVDEILQRTPTVVTRVAGSCWAVVYAIATSWVWFAMPTTAPIGPAEVGTVALFTIAASAGAGTVSFPFLNMALTRPRVALSDAMAARKLTRTSQRASLSRRLSLLILGIIIAPTALFAAAGQYTAVALERQNVATELRYALGEELARVEAGEPPSAAVTVSEGEVPVDLETAATDDVGRSDFRTVVDRRHGMISVAAPLSGGRWLLVQDSPRRKDRSHMITLAVFFGIIVMFALGQAVLVPRSLIEPLRSLETATRRLLAIGDIRELEPIPVIQYDELGTLTESFNELVANLRMVADAALKVAGGNLAADIEGMGDLQDAFRGMLSRLEEMVLRILETATDVGGAASEIYAATQGQEVASVEYTASVRAVSVRVDSLAESASHITSRATGVLDNAAQTSTQADSMVDKINELSAQANGIADLLEIIRDIADRSDLLALNGSLEATRAGEAGRGFALVAGEMRRLAERVTQTVGDVRDRVSDIKNSGANTVTATETSRRLAEDTASAAQDIVTLTRTQSEDTAHVSESMRAMSESVVAASAAVSQTRAAAEGLRRQVEELERLTRQFQLRGK